MTAIIAPDQANEDASGISVRYPSILVVDDDPLMIKLLMSFLHQENYHIEGACDGYDALDKWRDKAQSLESFDLLIIDLKMPRMNGLTLLKKIRDLDASVPIIILTGHSNLENAYNLLQQYNIADFLTKPLTGCERLLFTVKNALEKFALTKALKQLNEELEQRVQQRTIALQYAKEDAEAASEAKTRFLNRMKHELRTPLNAIIGFAQIQQLNTNATEQERINTDCIYQAGMALLTEVNDIMTVDSVNRNKCKSILLEPCQLDEAINSSIRFVGKLAAEHQVSINYQAGAGTVKACPYRLKQVLTNLLTNAVKFNTRGGFVNITVNVLADKEVEVCIIDSGIGIAPQDQQVIFDPFTRLTYADVNEIGGTGIGLALVKFLMDQMQGSIGLYSEPDNGSTFWLRLKS